MKRAEGRWCVRASGNTRRTGEAKCEEQARTVGSVGGRFSNRKPPSRLEQAAVKGVDRKISCIEGRGSACRRCARTSADSPR